MKRIFLAGCLAAVGVGVGGAASAQTDPAPTPTPRTVVTESQKKETTKKHEARNGHLVHANMVLEMTVRNPEGKEIGSVEDMIIDSQGRVAFLVLQFEDEFVKGDMLYAVPPQCLKPGSDPNQSDLILIQGKEKFATAKGFKDDQYPAFDEQMIRDTYKQFDQEPFWEGRMDRQDRRADDRDRTDQKDIQPDRDPVTPIQPKQNDPTRLPGTDNRESDVDGGRNNDASVGQKSDAQRRADYREPPQFDRAITWRNRLTKIVGKNVVNSKNEDLGSIEDLLIDVRSNRAVYAVLSDGGVLGINEKLTPIPYSALKVDAKKEKFTLDATKESIAANSFAEGNWPDLNDRQWAQKIHSQFNQDPYWAVYGFGGSDDTDEHWKHGSTYNKSFDAKHMTTVKGTVTSVSEFSPAVEAGKGQQITLRTDDGKTQTVHLGPVSYLKENNRLMIKQGDEVTVTGATCTYQDKEVMIATQVRTKDGKTVELRDKSGQPKWDSQDDNRKDNDRGTDRKDSDTRIEPRP